jgi:hypothetical protein
LTVAWTASPASPRWSGSPESGGFTAAALHLIPLTARDPTIASVVKAGNGTPANTRDEEELLSVTARYDYSIHHGQCRVRKSMAIACSAREVCRLFPRSPARAMVPCRSCKDASPHSPQNQMVPRNARFRKQSNPNGDCHIPTLRRFVAVAAAVNEEWIHHVVITSGQFAAAWHRRPARDRYVRMLRCPRRLDTSLLQCHGQFPGEIEYSVKKMAAPNSIDHAPLLSIG